MEDDEDLNSMLVTILNEEGYQVDSAANGQEAWEMLLASQYHLLATDLYMPKMDGLDLAIKVRNDFPDMPIILMSGGGRDLQAEPGQKQVKLLGREVEVDIFLKKPCMLNDILDSVDALL